MFEQKQRLLSVVLSWPRLSSLALPQLRLTLPRGLTAPISSLFLALEHFL